MELQNPVFTNGICSATLVLYKQVSGALTQMTNTQTTCHDNLELHAVVGGPQIIVYADNVELMWVWDSSLTTGKGGVGGRSMPAGNSIAQVDLGRLDMTGPNAIVSSSVSSSIFPDRADLAWQGVVDDTNGVGLFGYLCYLNNNFVGMRRTPDVSLVTLSPSTAYNLVCYPEDFHGSTGSPLVLNFNTPAAGAIDPRRTGVHALGTHWGGMGENIDLQSGNLNFSIPLLKAQGRGGWGATAALTYNSQQWRKDVLNGGTNYWKLGSDTGTGFGWTVQFGYITPFYSDYWTVHHWTFVDAQGTSYKLDINNSGQWTSKEGVFVTWDAAKRKLFFPDGSFWFFDCVAAGTEPDAGTRYPTLMQDTNGNQIAVRYKAGMELSYQNLSGRIWEIEDVRASGQSNGRYITYQFCYDDQALYYCDYAASGGSSIHHLQKIQNYIGTGEGFTFTYNSNVSLADPYASQSFGTVSTLQSITSSNSLQHLMTHNSAGELTQITYPYGGTFAWNYAAKELKGRFMREVTSRVLNAQDGNGNLTYTLYRDDAGDAQRFPTPSWSSSMLPIKPTKPISLKHIHTGAWAF